jgi:hypothetical protein
VQECVYFFSAARSLRAEAGNSRRICCFAAFASLAAAQNVFGTASALVTASAVKKKRNGSQASRKRHIGGWPKVFAFHFLSRCASDTKEIL